MVCRTFNAITRHKTDINLEKDEGICIPNLGKLPPRLFCLLEPPYLKPTFYNVNTLTRINQKRDVYLLQYNSAFAYLGQAN